MQKNLRMELRKFYAADEEKVLMIQEAVGKKQDAEKREELLRRRNKRVHVWIKNQRAQLKSFASHEEASRKQREQLRVERKQYELTSMVLAVVLVDELEKMTLIEQIKLLMQTAEFVGVNPLELGYAPQAALAMAYNVVIHKRTDEFIRDALASHIARV